MVRPVEAGGVVVDAVLYPPRGDSAVGEVGVTLVQRAVSTLVERIGGISPDNHIERVVRGGTPVVPACGGDIVGDAVELTRDERTRIAQGFQLRIGRVHRERQDFLLHLRNGRLARRRLRIYVGLKGGVRRLPLRGLGVQCF